MTIHSKRILIFLAVLMLAFAGSLQLADAQVTPEDDDVLMRGWVKDDFGQFIIIAELDMGSQSGAKAGYRMLTDVTYLEDELDVMIVQSQDVTGNELKGLGADEATLHGAVTEDFDASLIVVAREGDRVYLMVLVSTEGDDLDAQTFAQLAHDVIRDGLEDVDDPRGYTEEDMDDADLLDL